MKLIFALFCVIFLTQHAALGKSLMQEEENEWWPCVEDIFREIELDLERLGDMAGEFVATVSRLRDHRQRCFDMLSDPPTPLEEIRHEACMVAWRASVLHDVVRMRNIAQGSDAQEIFDQLQQDIFECLGVEEDEIPNPLAV